jgi:TolB-like protein
MNTKMLLALSLLAGVAIHAAPLTVAVYDFKGDGEAASYGDNVTTLVTADLTTKTNLVLVERSELDKALNEQAFGASGMVSADAAAKVGQITGAKVLVAGQVIKTGKDHLILVANIIGTETGRLFANKTEGTADDLSGLTSDLSRKIAQTIQEQVTNLESAQQESSEARLERIVKMISGTNRPAVSISITGYNWGHTWRDDGVANELGLILMKAGFPVMDQNSDRKPDVEITGSLTWDTRKQRGNMSVCSATLDLKAMERRTGVIKILEHQESTATGVGEMVAASAAKVKVADDLAERILPILAK